MTIQATDAGHGQRRARERRRRSAAAAGGTAGHGAPAAARPASRPPCWRAARPAGRPAAWPVGNAAHWMGVIPELVATPSRHRPRPARPRRIGGAGDGSLDGDRVLAWLGELIERTCSTPPALVGQLLGGAIAARFASARGDRLSRLVLVDTLRPSTVPAGAGVRARADRVPGAADRSRRTTSLWRHCAFDLDACASAWASSWQPFEAYNLDRAAHAERAGCARRADGSSSGCPRSQQRTSRASPCPTTPDLGAARPRDAACRSPRPPAPATAGRCT